jgi:hypothetical protein
VTRFVLRLLIVPIAIGFAAIAAFLVGMAGTLAWGHGESLAEFAAETGISIVVAALLGTPPDDIGAFLTLLWLVALGVLVLPIALVALTGEVFGITSWIVYAFGMAAAFALVPILFPGDPSGRGWPDNALIGFLATGFAAGSVYWLIAGRSAARPVGQGDDGERG